MAGRGPGRGAGRGRGKKPEPHAPGQAPGPGPTGPQQTPAGAAAVPSQPPAQSAWSRPQQPPAEQPPQQRPTSVGRGQRPPSAGGRGQGPPPGVPGGPAAGRGLQAPASRAQQPLGAGPGAGYPPPGPPGFEGQPPPGGVPVAAPPGPTGGSGRATFRGSSKSGAPGGNGNGNGQQPTPDELAQEIGVMSVTGEVLKTLAEEGGRRPRFNPYEDGNYKPAKIVDKTGSSGRKIMLKGNFYKLNYDRDWMLYQYHVNFQPPVENKKMKNALLNSHKELIGEVKAFDGQILFLPNKLPELEYTVHSNRRHDNANIAITIKFTCEVAPRTPTTLQVMNIIWRRCLSMMGMTQIQRHFFNTADSVKVQGHGLDVIPGFQTSILAYENEVLLEIDLTHKILRTESVLDCMYQMYRNCRNNMNMFRQQATKVVIGQIVMTRYNNKTYRVDDIDWDATVNDTFNLANGNVKSYVQYYKEQYNIDIKDDKQPLLVSRPKKKDIRRGQVGMIYLVPELCVITGLSDEARADFNLMKDVHVHTRIGPEGRVGRLMTFMNNLRQKPDVCKELGQWNLNFERELANIPARVMDQEPIYMYGRRGESVPLQYDQSQADWSRDMRGKSMLLAVELHDWIIVVPKGASRQASDLQDTVMQVGPPMGMKIAKPKMVEIPSDRNEHYLAALRENMSKTVQMVCCVLTSNKKDRYDSLKKFCCIDYPVPSQMVLTKTLNKQKQLMSVATKIAIQMNCKMGGVVWSVRIPIKKSMIVGIDTYHDSSQRGRSCCGVVASISEDHCRYYSTVTYQMTHQELSDNLCVSMTECLHAFQKEQGCLPERVIVFRDGVGDGQLHVVAGHECPQIYRALLAAGGEGYAVQMAFVIVKKRINARFFRPGGTGGRGDQGISNPGPGTVIDDVATKKTWFDFFLISQSVRQGTVGPTHYNVVHDTTTLKPEHFQLLAYKLTHMYFNWQGTVRVPAPCMYAHKLAFLCGQSLHRNFHHGLADKLFFL